MKNVRAELITIGDELLYGQTLDTNAHWMSGELDAIGVKVIRRTTCGDVEEEVLTAFAEAENRADIILITGGLGPTNDDLTKPCLARYFDCDIVMNEQALQELEHYMSGRGRKLNKLTRLQAALPEKCDMVSNECGTACGVWFRKNNTVFCSMPGVPHEMKHMMSQHVLPRIKREFDLPVIYHKIVRIAGIGESWLAEKIVDWEQALPAHIRLAYLPAFGEIKLRLTAQGKVKQKLQAETDALISQLIPQIKEYVYGYDDDTLERTVGQLLRQQGKTLALAESCTGGFVAHRITSVPGSSDYFLGGLIPYQNEIKSKQLGVRENTLAQHGAVSEETVREMSSNIREKMGATIGLATSGIAGPGGGTPDKPVGLVWIACADEQQVTTKKLQLTQNRMLNIQLTTVALLNLLRQRLTQND